MDFAARVTERVRRLDTRLCLGLDPRPDWHPPGLELTTHCRELLEACAPFVCAVKPQVAFFEAQGLPGLQALGELLELARSMDVPVIVDAKRGDIGSTAEAYARAWLSGGRAGCALTVNPFLGRDSVEPFVTAARSGGGGVFCLVRTSNPGADDLQGLGTGQGTISDVVASWVTAWNGPGEGYGPVGAVVGATRPGELAHFRELLPRSLLLLPGLGPQGGKPGDLAPAFHPGGLGAVASASRAIEYASKGSDFAKAGAAAARELRDALNASLA